MTALMLLALGFSCSSTPGAQESLDQGFLMSAPASEWRELPAAQFVAWTGSALERLNGVATYTCEMQAIERIDGKLGPRKRFFLQVRQRPFAVELQTLEPASEKGMLIQFDESKNGGKLKVATPGLLGKLIGKVSLAPEGGLAMKEQRHPVTDVGLQRLAEQIRERWSELSTADPKLRVVIAEALLEGRAVQLVEIRVPGADASQSIQRMGFDPQWGVFTYYALSESGPAGVLLQEEYLYSGIEWDAALKQ